ncbi:hypothetical protein [Frigoriflavimonas asaccharolytica]|uniref:Uncharacterized protein n=1 Tax=Frigoriflavimonas asaccharolytica TaxID=2735899 RepID=A0A8J8KA40_9FLAO|nr:hypothetical protein [Frigoriflavimonas asaccharolytica]NRS93767.1 hypothetical protein [Frigoriflavimonas asaccharolytica]
MTNLKLSTKNPQQLKNDINDKINSNEITTWEYDATKKLISHKGDQYRNQFYFEYKIDDPKGILEFVFHSGGSDFANLRAYQLLERMLLSHFSHQIEIIK